MTSESEKPGDAECDGALAITDLAPSRKQPGTAPRRPARRRRHEPPNAGPCPTVTGRGFHLCAAERQPRCALGAGGEASPPWAATFGLASSACSRFP